MVLKHQQLLKTPLFGLEEDEITWYSNSKKCSECCTVGLADVKLHGLKLDWRRNWFGKRKITGHSNPTLCLSILKQGLEEEKITGFSNQT